MTQIQNFKMYINGEWVNSSSGRVIKTLNPETNEVWATVPEANEEDVNKAVQAAQKAFDGSWSKLHPKERAKFLRNVRLTTDSSRSRQSRSGYQRINCSDENTNGIFCRVASGQCIRRPKPG